MARINIEDSFWLEIIPTVLAFGDQDKAIGNVVRFFRHAQERAKAGKFISEDEFKALGFSESLFPAFARRTDEGIQAAGFEKHFGWLQKRVEAGRKGGESKAKQTVAKGSKPGKGQETEPSPSYSPSYSSSRSSKVPSEPTKANAFVAMYCEGFKRRWGENPQILGKDAGIAKRLAKDLSPDRFAYLLDAYFAMPDAWLVKTKHPLGAFETKLNEVVLFAEQGAFTTATQVRQADQMATNHLLMEKLKREGK